MSDRVLVDQLSAEEWSAEALCFSDHNIYQAWGFGEQSAEDSGATISRIIVQRDGDTIGMAQLRIKKIPMVGTGLAYAYRGPLWKRPGATIEDWRRVLAWIREEYALRRGLVARIAPNMWIFQNDDACADEHRASQLREVGDGFTWEDERTVDRTVMLDLSPPIDELRKRLEQKWRNGLNQSERKGLTIRDAVDDNAMEQFERLYAKMWEKKRFETGVSVSSFRRLQERLPDDSKLRVALAHQGDELVAGHVSSTLGGTCIYLLGASNEVGRQSKASYLLQWHTVQAAKAAGARWYDLGGIDPEGNPGVYHFKSGLGGREATFAAQLTASPEGVAKTIAPLAERAYRMLNRVKRRFAEGAAPKT